MSSDRSKRTRIKMGQLVNIKVRFATPETRAELIRLLRAWPDLFYAINDTLSETEQRAVSDLLARARREEKGNGNG